MPSRIALPILSLALVMTTIAPLTTPAAAEEIYSFVDERGVVHLSNVPSDPRYQLTAQLRVMVSSDLGEPEQPFAPLLTDEELNGGGRRFDPVTIIAQPQNER
jgi:Domain of unknown function (DUF4124)